MHRRIAHHFQRVDAARHAVPEPAALGAVGIAAAALLRRRVKPI